MTTSGVRPSMPWSSSTWTRRRPSETLAIVPDGAGNLLEVIILELADDRLLAIHTMPLRSAYYGLLPPRED